MHTPLPWEVQRLRHADEEVWIQIGHAGRGPITELIGGAVHDIPPDWTPVARMKYLIASDSEQQANANLIVRAVNAHPRLVEALRRMVEYHADHKDKRECGCDACAAARALLAEIEKED